MQAFIDMAKEDTANLKAEFKKEIDEYLVDLRNETIQPLRESENAVALTMYFKKTMSYIQDSPCLFIIQSWLLTNNHGCLINKQELIPILVLQL